MENTHGGKRAGSGRKTKYEKTVVMRVPERYKESIKAMIAHLDETADLDGHFPAAESEPVYLRSLSDKRQHISITVKPF